MRKSLSYDGRGTRTCRYGLAEAYLAMSQYCNKFLRMAEDDSGMYLSNLHVLSC